MVEGGKLCFFYHGQTFANINLQNELVLGVAISAQMNGNLEESY